MITTTSLRATGLAVAYTITVAAAGLNAAHKAADPLADYPLGTFVVEVASTATTAGAVEAITVQHGITGDIISVLPPAQENYVGLMIRGGKIRNST